MLSKALVGSSLLALCSHKKIKESVHVTDLASDDANQHSFILTLTASQLANLHCRGTEPFYCWRACSHTGAWVASSFHQGASYSTTNREA